MRKFMLVTAIVLVSASAHAEPWKSFSLASEKNTKQFVERPETVRSDKVVEPTRQPQTQPQATDAKPDAKSADAKSADIKSADTRSADAQPAEVKPAKAKRKRVSMEAHIIYQLHRAGYYW
jgi:hypothetical protein